MLRVDPALVHPVRHDEAAKRLVRDGKALDDIPQGHHHGVARLAGGRLGVHTRQLVIPLVEQRGAVALGLVAEVVGETAEGVDDVEIGAQGTG